MKPPAFDMATILLHYGAELPPVKAGWQQMRCVIHEDGRPSASVNYQLQRYHCFTCMSKSEDTVGVVQRAENCGFRDAVSRCQEITGSSGGSVRERAPRKPGLSALFD